MEQSRRLALEETAAQIRKLTVKTIGNFGVGHIGGSASIVEVMTALYFEKANIDPKNPKWKNRDRIVLSKGHAGPCMYSTLARRGYFEEELLLTMNRPGTSLPSHVDMNRAPGVDFTAGSLGQGLSAAVGLALAARLDGLAYRVFAILGDGESQEGQVWEAAMYAGNQKLDNLTVFLDNNKMQIDGTTNEINSIEPIANKWRAFNFHVLEVDGHDVGAICDCIDAAKKIKDKPTMIILDTVKGKGIRCCEGTVQSHSVALSKEMWMKELEDDHA